MMRNKSVLVLMLLAAAGNLRAADPGDPLAPWRSGVQIRPAAPAGERHSIHSYFNTSPESPDGRHVLYFTSTTPEGHHGDIRIVERISGKETTLVSGVHVEDAHCVAC